MAAALIEKAFRELDTDRVRYISASFVCCNEPFVRRMG
jgi:hypothetical protein